MNKPWEQIAKEKQKSLIANIPLEWIVPSIKNDMLKAGYVNTSEYLDTILPDAETSIINKQIPELIKSISSGELTALEITKAFTHRASLAHQILNCCSEIFISKAFERAKKLDDIFEKTGKIVGPLHGIPISLKDQVDLEGIPSAIGYVSLANKPASKNALLADKLMSLGAIFFVKTAVPMAMMAPETCSNLLPYNNSAVNINLSSGGSSGGEGSLVAAGGARVGFGTDIGGSIRIPSSYNGLFAMKPSVGRVSYLRVKNSYCAQECIPSVIGPMTKSLEEVDYIMKCVVLTKAWLEDPKILPLEWKESSLDDKKIKIGIWFDSGNVEPMPAIKRVLDEVNEDLINAGYKVVKVVWPEHERLLQALYKVFGADQGKEIIEECKKSGEPVHELLDYLVTGFEPEPMKVNEWWDLCEEVYLIKQIYLNFWKDQCLDAIIAPIMPTTSVLPFSKVCLDYTGVSNLCDCVGVVLPLGNVDKKIDLLQTREPRNEIEKSIREGYDPKIFDKMPVCLQIITKKTEEEKGLAIAKKVKTSSRYYK